MNPIARKYGAPVLPQVNLVPKDLNDKRVMRFAQTIALIAALAVVGVVIIGFLGALATKQVASSGLHDALKDEDAAVESRDAKRDVYAAYVAQEQDEVALAEIGWSEMDYAALMDDVAAQSSTTAVFVTLNFQLPTAEGTGGTTKDKLLGGGVGSIDFIAHASTYEEGLAFIARLEAVPGLARVVGTVQAYESEPPVTSWQITGTMEIMPNYLTGRLTPQGGVIQSQILDRIIGARESGDGTATTFSAAPTPTPSASASAQSGK